MKMREKLIEIVRSGFWDTEASAASMVDEILDAMLDPDEEMVLAGVGAAFSVDLDGPDGIGMSDLRAIWQAMITTAKE